MNSKQEKIFLVLMVILTILTVVAVGLIVKDRKSQTSKPGGADSSTQSQSQAGKDRIEYKGKTYEYDSDLTNILFLGIDKADDIDKTYMPGKPVRRTAL